MRKWTIIDTLIAVVIVCVAVVGVKMLGNSDGASEKTKMEIVVLASNKDVGFADSVKTGEKANLSLTEKNGGIVTKVEKKHNKVTTFNSVDGTYQNIENGEKEDVYIYVEADCDITDKSIKIGDTIVRVGEGISIRGKGYASEAFIVEINERGEE